jgi:Double-GTPase 2
MPDPWPLTPDSCLRIVLFGMPGAGKTSLLGALAQAAQTQENALSGHLGDLSHGLEELQQRLYEGTSRQTQDEIVPYPVTFDAIASSSAGGAHSNAIFVDCDGRAANELLTKRRSLGAEVGDGALAGEILASDTLLLVIDASAAPTDIETAFALFSEFLRLLEQCRGGRSDVAGLPIFLVLTKCDLLAQANDTAAEWVDRIEKRKRDVTMRFQAFLARHPVGGHVPFGRVHLHFRCTAVKHPELADRPPQPRQPFGVAELFRQCLRSARSFRRRQKRSARRLLWTTVGTVGIVALMVAFAASRLAGRHEVVGSALSDKIADYRASEGDTVSLRLREPLQQKIGELIDFEHDPDFPALPEEEQNYVQQRLGELEAYRAFWDKIRGVSLDEVRSQADVERLIRRLAGGDLDTPAPHQSEWEETQAGLRHGKLLKNLYALRARAREAEDWFRESIQRGEDLWTCARGKPSNAPAWSEWQRQISALVTRPFPHRESDEVPGSEGLTYEAIFRFDQVASARRDWEALRLRLERLDALSAALGLAGKLPNGERQPLDIPERFVVSESGGRHRQLTKLYPHLEQALAKVKLPDSISGDLRRAARLSYDHLIEAGRQVVLKYLQQAATAEQETASLWRGAREWLAGASELREWRVLATLLGRILDLPTPDPVTTLVAFLGLDHFDINIERVALEVPVDRHLAPAGPLTIYHAAPGAEPVAALTFRLAGAEGHRDSRKRTASFSFDAGRGTPVVYRPGDLLYAVLPVQRNGEGDWRLTWGRGRSQVYQFERLVRPPRLHRKEQDNTQGDLVEDIQLVLQPPEGVPSLPDLMPVVNLKKR